MLTLTAFMAGVYPLMGSAHAATAAVTQTKSGLDHFDSLTTGNLNYWVVYGSAPAEGAPYGYNENSSGLYLRVQSKVGMAQYAGLFAESPKTEATAYHAIITLPYKSIIGADNYFNTGMYIQTNDSTYINYVACAAVASQYGYQWAVVQSYGVVLAAATTTVLWSGPLNSGPLTEDCTIITNGNNYLKVYLGGAVVYESSTLNLMMPSPFNSYIEVQTNSATAMRYSNYTYYYSTFGENVSVTNAPVGGTVSIVDSSNTVLASAPISAAGVATLPVGKYRLPLTANIDVYDSAHSLVAATPTPVTIWGGDAFSASTGSSSTSSTTSSTTTSTTTTSTTTTTTTTTSSTTSAGGIGLTGTQSTSGSATAPPFQLTISNFNAGTGANHLLVVGISSNNQAATSVTFAGLALTRAALSYYNEDSEFWYLDGMPSGYPASGVGNIVVTMGGPTSAAVGAYAFTGVDQGIPIATVATSHNSVAGSPTVTITTQHANSWVLDLPSIYGGVTLGSPTCAQHWDANVPGAVSGASSSAAASAPGQVTCSWTASGGGDFWDDVAIEIQAAPTSAGITVYASRIQSSYWDPCFASTCSAGTGPGTTMYFELYNSAGTLIQSGYANENGYTFTGLSPGTTYYVYPDDCNACHGSMHNVVFQYWGDGSTVRPMAATVGTSLDAWYSCTNNCA